MGSDYYLYCMLRHGDFRYGEGDLSRTIVGDIPLFNKLAPIDLFSKNGILTVLNIPTQEQGFDYAPLMDISQLGLNHM